MGPHDTTRLSELQRFIRDHPEVIVTFPSETHSGYWEVSLPDRGTMAFDSSDGVMRALRVRYPEDTGDTGEPQ